MARTDDGEVEWILGNRQLLSVFFVVVILLGVFFTLGYVVGRSSGSGTETTLASAKQGAPSSGPLIVEPALREPETTPPDLAKAAPAPVRRPSLPAEKPAAKPEITGL